MNTPFQAVSSRGTNRAEMAREAERTARRPAGWWAMLVLVINEAVLFATLVAGYFYLRFNSPVWPQDNLKRPDLALPAVLTVLLAASSIAMQWGLSSVRRGQLGRMRAALFAALLLAAGFLILQGVQFTRSEFGPQANAYASLFFTITGLHSAHVLIAILMNGFIQVRAKYRHFTAQRYLAVENVVFYWHFVTIVWFVVFLSLYLSTYLS